jgi:hypothetical protein
MEEMLISLNHLLLQTFRVNGGQSIYTGHTVSYANDNTRFITKLPLTVSSLDVLVVKYRLAPYFSLGDRWSGTSGSIQRL